MIGGISSSAVSAAAARFDRVAVAVTDAVAGDGGEAGPDVGGVGDAMVAMAAAKFAFLATLQVARTSNEMVDQMLGEFRVGAR